MLAKYQLKYTYEGDKEYAPVDVTFEVPGDATITQLINQFQYYLKACGYIFDGDIKLVDNSIVYNDEDNECTEENCCQSEISSSTQEWNKQLRKLEASIRSRSSRSQE